MATNMGNTKSVLLRATALGGIAGAAMLAAMPAQAATGSISNVAVTDRANTGQCRVTFNYSVVGTDADVSGSDYWAQTLELGSAIERRRNEGTSVGSTENGSDALDTVGNPPRGQRVLYLREVSVNGGSFTGTIDSVPLSRSALIAAGGNCALSAPNAAPVVDAGPDQTAAGTNITLSGSATDADGDAVSYQWVQVSGPAATIASQNSQSTGVTLPATTTPTTFTFRLDATDAALETSSDVVSITSGAPNNAPTVNAGPNQTVAGGDTVQLSGSANDVDNDPLTVTWTQTSGPAITLSDPNALNPTFTAPARTRDDQTLAFELRADDGTVISSDTVDIVVAGNEAPNVVATASPTSGAGNSQFTLDGSGTTDPEGDQIIYIWTQTSGPSVTIDNPSAAVTTFTAPAGGLGTNQTLTFELTAVDTFDESNTEAVSVTLLANEGPTADAGADQDVSAASTVTLDGSGSTDPDGDTLFYTWTQVSGPAVTLSDANIVNPTFLAPASTGQDQLIEFELLVEDRDTTNTSRLSNQPGSDTDRVVITVLANRPPVADAGADQGPIDAGQTVTLDGSGSSDPDDGTRLTYSWVQTAGPTVTLTGANTATPSFVVPQFSGSLSFELTVSDGSLTASSTVDVVARETGSITIIQQINGTDTQVSFTSNLAALQTSVTTSGGTGQISAQSVSTGTYTVTAADLAAQGIAVTDIICSDDDSTGNVASRTATINLAAGESVTCTFSAANSREAAQAAIYSFLTGRNALILANQPDLQRRIDRLSPGGGAGSGSLSAYGVNVPFSDRLPVQASIAEGQARFRSDLTMAIGGSSDRVFDIWGEAVFSSATIGTQEASFSIFSIGADIKLGDDVLIGALAQFDDLSDKGNLDAGEAEGDGYLIGPYLTARLAEGFFVEARAAWGSSDNVVSPLQGQRDAFETSRSLYSGSLIGQVSLGDKTTFRPELTLRYLSEDQEAYTDSLNIVIPAQTVDQGDLSFRPRISHLIDAGGFTLRPYGQVEGIYTFGTEPDAALANLLPGNFADTFGDIRARIEGGIDLMGEGTFRATFSGFVDGIGSDGFSNEGVRLGVSFGF